MTWTITSSITAPLIRNATLQQTLFEGLSLLLYSCENINWTDFLSGGKLLSFQLDLNFKWKFSFVTGLNNGILKPINFFWNRRFACVTKDETSRGPKFRDSPLEQIKDSFGILEPGYWTQDKHETKHNDNETPRAAERERRLQRLKIGKSQPKSQSPGATRTLTVVYRC